jgi:hypothetical protein
MVRGISGLLAKKKGVVLYLAFGTITCDQQVAELEFVLLMYRFMSKEKTGVLFL